MAAAGWKAPAGTAEILKQAARELVERGVTVVPMLDAKELSHFRARMLTSLRSMPEYLPERKGAKKKGKEYEHFVRGGFGALGNPASFHNDFVRELRLRAMFTAIPFFAEVDRKQRRHRALEMLMDRTMYRAPDKEPEAESWHRDVSLSLLVDTDRILTATKDTKGELTVDPSKGDDDVFGGWINLDAANTAPQQFSCVPGSHKKKYVVGYKRERPPLCPAEVSGFAKLPENQHAAAKAAAESIKVPPGHWIVFYQNIVHEVKPGRKTHYVSRLFTGYRLTSPGSDPMFDQTQVIARQGVPLLPSGQHPPMFEKMLSNLKGISKWSQETFVPQVLHGHEVKTGTSKGATYVIIDRCAKSLADYGLTLYAAYRPEESALFQPNVRWKLPVWTGAAFDWTRVRPFRLTVGPDEPLRRRDPNETETELESDASDIDSQSDDDADSQSDADPQSGSAAASDLDEGDEDEKGPSAPAASANSAAAAAAAAARDAKEAEAAALDAARAAQEAEAAAAQEAEAQRRRARDARLRAAIARARDEESEAASLYANSMFGEPRRTGGGRPLPLPLLRPRPMRSGGFAPLLHWPMRRPLTYGAFLPAGAPPLALGASRVSPIDGRMLLPQSGLGVYQGSLIGGGIQTSRKLALRRVGLIEGRSPVRRVKGRGGCPRGQVPREAYERHLPSGRIVQVPAGCIAAEGLTARKGKAVKEGVVAYKIKRPGLLRGHGYKQTASKGIREQAIRGAVRELGGDREAALAVARHLNLIVTRSRNRRKNRQGLLNAAADLKWMGREYGFKGFAQGRTLDQIRAHTSQ